MANGPYLLPPLYKASRTFFLSQSQSCRSPNHTNIHSLTRLLINAHTRQWRSLNPELCLWLWRQPQSSLSSGPQRLKRLPHLHRLLLPESRRLRSLSAAPLRLLRSSMVLHSGSERLFRVSMYAEWSVREDRLFFRDLCS